MNATRTSLIVSGLLWLGILALLALLSLRHDWQVDWTANARNTLTPASRTLLQAMPDPIRATAYVFPNVEVRREIEARFAPYQRERADIALRFVDPTTDPQTVRELGIDQSGEVVIEYQGRRENLKTLSEPDISAALQRLSYAEQAQIAFVSGHGERDPRGQDQAGYSELSKLLLNKGLKLSSFSLATQAIPNTIALLVLAAPQRDLLAGEIKRLQSYLERGGNLLWLTDPDLPLIPELAQSLDLQQVAEYPQHPITKHLTEIGAFAFTSGLSRPLPAATSTTAWDTQSILRSTQRSWLETGPLDGDLLFNQGEDLLGPIDFGFALARPPASDQREQRALAIADSDFLSNAYLSQLGNRPLGVALFQWLIQRDAQIQVDLPMAPDRTLQLSPAATKMLALIFVLLLPLGLLGTGLLRWWLRQKRR
jgi:ABC-type uncharacterized transport system involved in gliding motility auxiliary subunit